MVGNASLTFEEVHKALLLEYDTVVANIREVHYEIEATSINDPRYVKNMERLKHVTEKIWRLKETWEEAIRTMEWKNGTED